MENLQEIENYLRKGEYPPTINSKTEKANFRRKCRQNFKFENGSLYYKKHTKAADAADWRICVRSNEEKSRILEDCHAAGGHFGRDRTIDKICSRFYWKSMVEEIREYVKNCSQCQRMNPAFVKTNAKLHPISVQPKVWHQVGIDLIGPLPITPNGSKYVVTLVDYFSKWAEAAPLPDKTAFGVAMFLYNLFCRFGFCEVLISDQGREFVNQVNTELFRFTGTEHRVTSAYHPQTNGLTERFNQTLQTALLKYVNDSQTDWDYHLPAILFAYRTSKQKATKYSPFELMFCRKPVLPIQLELGSEGELEQSWDISAIMTHARAVTKLKDDIHSKAKKNIDNAQEKDKMYYDRKHADKRVFKTGTLVWLRNSARECKKGDKLKPRWLGPYTVVECLDKGVFKIANPKTGKTLKKAVNQQRLKHYHGSDSEKPIFDQHSSLSDPSELSDNHHDESLDQFNPSLTSTPMKDPSKKLWEKNCDFPSSHKPDAPSSHKPAAPSSHKPDVPSSHKPAAPSSHKPDVPSSHKPAAPSSHKPDVPSSHKPDVPSSHKPAAPSSHKPDVPSSHKPAAPSSHKPDVPSSHKPDAHSSRKRDAPFSQVKTASSMEPPLKKQRTTQSVTRKNSSYWVKDLDLRTGDKDVVLAESGMLSDRHMYAAHKLMRMQFPNIEGCYSTLLVQKMSFPAVTSSEATAVQIFFVTERHHWIATALIKGELFLFDSCFQYGKDLEPSAELQIAQMYKPLIAHNGLLLSVASIQQQSSGSNNCGLFAIAAAYHALQGDNLDTITLNEDKMRPHLVRCFENEKLRRFPKSKDVSSRKRPERFSSIVITIYCPCLRPDCYDEMVQCDTCTVWYHYKCVRIKVSPLGDWFCPTCRSR
ncbi:uncharacterized protein LOC135348618 isoform X3 [Halichondria panicea]|uniref:uncharacterized protein LOC135331877 isoform X3 n=1 Tax=Halichondria panicea TaxID=6063 RepID=UPI00312B50CE